MYADDLTMYDNIKYENSRLTFQHDPNKLDKDYSGQSCAV